ncbi:TetR family transcriptional regulator [Sphingomonas changnyeongensis]|uniref:TetR family transcriptional regulator n=1 Tax=Sphingomonas changnyeongensis TaxID=2698679 RepID=A0A7Z2NUS8_9SPHN|nr:TetR/AcrR family transcriptional regulator [Sphingomonas changnyeongensis]QHL90213.1 TetR family transcriptional regulator [Sphingomonas changnyeongensis]
MAGRRSGAATVAASDAASGPAADGAAAEAAAGGATDKTPRTARGRKTLRAILDAAAAEFGARGFHDTGITHITQRAGVALGTFYTYFNSKEEVFRALVRDMSAQVRDHVAPAIAAAPDGLAAERAGLASFLGFVRAHKEIYRIIDEAEFVDPDSYRAHYQNTADRIALRLGEAERRGDLSIADTEVVAWAIMGMNVFLGLRFGVLGDDRTPDEVAGIANALIARGLVRG